MDLPATQVCEDDDFTPTKKIALHSEQGAIKEDPEIGILSIGSNTYPIKKGINRIGRHPDCSIILNDQTVSKKHAEIEANTGEASAWICDLNSSNKTKLNNSVLRPGRCYELKDGNVLEFGMVRAIYKVHGALDDSLVPETPAVNHKKKQTIIPVTPDSSMDNSSSFGGNTSVIPGTQNENVGSMFRYPTLPLRISTSSTRNSGARDSSADNSLSDARSSFPGGKENVSEQKISIHDMETQKPYESDEQNDDIHEMDTQEVCLKKINSDTRVESIHDMETQPGDKDEQRQDTDIHDLETQQEENIHDVTTPTKMINQNVKPKTNTPCRITRIDTLGDKADKKVILKERIDVVNDKLQREMRTNVEETCSNNTDKFANKTEPVERTEKSLQGSQEYLQLSLTTNFEDETTELDKSRNLLGSQNLIDLMDDDDDQLDERNSKSPSVAKDSGTDDHNASNGKSTDDENIFDAATQVSRPDENAFPGNARRSENSFNAVMVDDSDDTDNECSFQICLRKDSHDTRGASKNQASDSDSVTDEEGHFMEEALKKRKNASRSLENSLNVCKDVKDNSGSSKDSEDLFEMLTQPVEPRNQIFSIKSRNVDDSKVDFDAPTQIVDTGGSKNNLRNEEHLKTPRANEPVDVDDLEPTQVLPATFSAKVPRPFSCPPKNEITSDEEDITEIEDNVATQILSCPENVRDREHSKSPNFVAPHATEECSVENIDYEMATTQLISEIEERKIKSSVSSKKNTPEKPKTVNKNDLDTTVEKNLHKMFDDVNDQRIEEQPQISTQTLETMLQSQCNEESTNKNLESSTKSLLSRDARKNSTRRRKTKSVLVSSPSSSVQETTSKYSATNVNTDDDSQGSENYFSALTSSRKRNIIADSQDSVGPVEELSKPHPGKEANAKVEDKSSKVCSSPTRSTPKPSSTPRSAAEVSTTPKSSRKSRAKVPETVVVSAAGGESIELTKTMNYPMYSPSTNGTLSNPASPTSSTTSDYRINVNNNRSKQISIMIAPQKRGASRRNARKSFPRGNVEVADLSGNSCNPLSDNIDGNKVNEIGNKHGEKIIKSKSSMRKTMAGDRRRSKEADSVLQPKTGIDSCENIRLSPSIQGNGRTRGSKKKNADCSSVFQVGKNASVEKAAEAKPVKKDLASELRIGKRSLSMIDAIETSDAKKRKEEVRSVEPARTRGRKRNGVVARRNSETILDYVAKRDSPVNLYVSSCVQVTPAEESMIREPVVKVMRLTPCTPTGSISPSNPAELKAENKGSTETRESGRTNVANSQNDSDPSIKENGRTQRKMGSRRGANRKTTGKSEQKAEEISREIGEESQEVEMIMNGALADRTIESKRATEKDVKGTKEAGKTRNKRNRAQENKDTDGNITESTASSDPAESDNNLFEASSVKGKRARVSKNVSNLANSTNNESIKRSSRSTRQLNKSTRSQKSTTDSSADENPDSTINQRNLDRTRNRGNNSRVTRGRKTGKAESDKDTTSEINSSIETASILSTPSRTRKSMASPFSTSSPSRMRHKILFTGISSSEYNKALTKLGASQVEDPAKCTVLVTDKVRRTVKFLCALAQSVPIVSVDWLINSEKSGLFVDLEDYILKDPAAEAKFGFNLEESLNTSKEHKLFEGYTLVLTPNISAPPLPELKSIIVSCGGKALVRPPPSWPQKAVIISREEDLANARKFLAKAPKGVTVQSTEFILTGILRQVLDFTEFQLK